MKEPPGYRHETGDMLVAESIETSKAVPLSVTTLFAAHSRYVWLALQRAGVRDADLEDALQEVFVVVHRRLDSFDGSSKVTTWLFAIALRVAAAFRRKAHVRREQQTDEVPDVADAAFDAEALAARKQARVALESILDGMDPERRATFVMFEIEEIPCERIAVEMGVPIGTVYSRLHKARKEFEASVARLRAKGGSS